MSQIQIACILILAVTTALAESDSNSSAYSTVNLQCQDGLFLRAWQPQTHLTTSERFARGTIYFLAMCYLFLGVSIVSDRFMAAIEMITSNEKEVKVKQTNGETQIVVVRIWNETVANLTLMALGTSAPEILLSIIEMFAKNFQAGELGPGTIVGSAAFNLFVIIALCVVVIPNGEVRKIKHLRVFFVTTVWSIFAYIWLYLILAKFSPGRLEIWEGLLTFLFFPATVATAYIADRRLLLYKYFDKTYRVNKRGLIVGTEGDLELGNNHYEVKHLEDTPNGAVCQDTKDFEESRREFLDIFREIRQKFPQRNIEDIEKMALERLLDKAPKSRAFYRMQGNRAFTRRGNLQKKLVQARAQNDVQEIKTEIRRSFSAESSRSEDSTIGKLFFNPGHYTVMESCGRVELKIVREGGLWQTCTIDYETEDGTAEAGSDYGYAKGTLTFLPGNDEQSIFIDIIDDDVFELDEVFYVRLQNNSDTVQIGTPNVATVMILDDDHAGFFTLNQKDHDLIESVGIYELVVKRLSGARGAVQVSYWTEDGTAKAGKDYEEQHGKLQFENNEVEKVIQLGIIEEGSYEKDVLFYVNLGEPQMVEAALIQAAEAKAPEDLTEEDKMALLGRPKAGDVVRAQLRIKESKEFKNTVDKLVQRANASLLIGTSSWKEQFTEALTVSPESGGGGGGDDGEDYEDGEEPKPSCGDYIMHFLTLFWKLIFAFIPPTDISGGYLCFVVSIFCIGVVTAIIGDVASHFGCTLGIKDSVTAVVFVALGTSVPDTFASKVAAIQDKYADASVGNVTGSNAVNVFLGIGVAWTIAAIYHEINGTSFDVEPGNLAFSVTLFCTEALIAIVVLLIRRSKAIGGELGGPVGIKYLSGAILLGLWLIYLIMSTLEAYHIIEGF
ncbi:sodium/calcium exchanger 1-like isoform X6 [Hermetia illucens]|uniref:sodium/calcium exchanger 1-like isoform X6 n=1 Tax=Hermetia illucens TaxID=343691 RepID=UPI0018CC0366|nr:sodium/calcium exchanger 1-like isoform X6 [Hermetia illucens]